MRYLTLLLLLAAVPANAATLVLTQLFGYQPPAKADIVRVLRNGVSSWAPIAEVLPTERIQICEDPAVAIGSTSTSACTTRVAGRTDNWQLKSLVFVSAPPMLGSVTFAWNVVTQNTDGSPAALSGYTVTVRRQNCGVGIEPGCEVAALDPPIELGPVLTYTVSNVALSACLFVQARSVANDLGLITSEVCGNPTKPKQIPAQVTGVRVVP